MVSQLTESDIQEEQAHFANVVATFQQYAQYSLSANNRRRKDLHTLSQPDKELLVELGYRQKLVEVDKAILVNAEFLHQIIEDPEIFGHDLASYSTEEEGGPVQDDQFASPGRSRSHSHSHQYSGHTHTHDQPSGFASQPAGHPCPIQRYKPTEFDMDKLRSTLKQFVRDWSEEGKEEREACYGPVKEALLNHFPDVTMDERRKLRVLVPGAGLGRLAYDIATLGFSCQGNEFSHYMLLSSYFILNRTHRINQHTLYPYIHSFSNIPSREAMLRPISLPDVLPSALPAGSDFSLVAGDFEEIYGNNNDKENAQEPHSGRWDVVVTCFFIDTAKNVVNYIRIIHRILAPGGVWINMGPLLWHWENNTTNDPSVELDLVEVKALVRSLGFEIHNERTIDTTYTNNLQSMLGYIYHTAFWTATKTS